MKTIYLCGITYVVMYSMYPKLWAASGVPYDDLLDRLIRLGFERHQDRKQNKYCL
jgi:D-alanine-D-alanine ligase